MKQQKFKISIIAMALMLTTISIQAQQQGPDHEGPRSEMRERGQRGPQGPGLPRIPGLTEEQKEQMKAIHLEIEQEALPVKNQVDIKEAILKSQITAEDYDERAVNKTIDEIGSLKTQLQKLRVSGLQKAKEVLNEEQLLFLYNHMDQTPGKGKGPTGHGPKGGRRG